MALKIAGHGTYYILKDEYTDVVHGNRLRMYKPCLNLESIVIVEQ